MQTVLHFGLACRICFCTRSLVHMYVMGSSNAKGFTFMQTMSPVSAPAARKLYVAKLKNRFIRAMFSEKAHLHTSRVCVKAMFGKKATVHTSKDCKEWQPHCVADVLRSELMQDLSCLWDSVHVWLLQMHAKKADLACQQAYMKYPTFSSPKRQNTNSNPLGPPSGMMPPATIIRYHPYL